MSDDWPRERWPADDAGELSKALHEVMTLRVMVGVATSYVYDGRYDEALKVLDNVNESFTSGEPWWLGLA